jgi:hypothetical protein
MKEALLDLATLLIGFAMLTSAVWLAWTAVYVPS